MTKTIAVFGATGRTGRVFVDVALQAGWHVRAGVRNNTLPAHDNLTVVTCDITKPDDIANVLRDCDAVVSLLGHRFKSPAKLQTDAMNVITEQMKLLNIRRIVSLTGTGVRRPGDKVNIVDRLANMAIAIVDPARVNDGKAHVDVLEQSQLDWTVVRVLKLTNGKAEQYRLTRGGPAKTLVSRQTVADALVSVLYDNKYIHSLPVVSKK